MNLSHEAKANLVFQILLANKGSLFNHSNVKVFDVWLSVLFKVLKMNINEKLKSRSSQSALEYFLLFKTSTRKKNPANGRQRFYRPMRIVAQQPKNFKTFFIPPQRWRRRRRCRRQGAFGHGDSMKESAKRQIL